MSMALRRVKYAMKLMPAGQAIQGRERMGCERTEIHKLVKRHGFRVVNERLMATPLP